MFNQKTFWFGLLLFCVIGAVAISIGGVRGANAAAPSAVSDTPVVVTTESLTEWGVSDGLIYWTYNCGGGPSEFRNAGYLRRQPTTGSVAQTLATLANENCFNFRQLTVDASGIYYFNGDASPSRIEFRASGSPLTPKTIYNTSGVAGKQLRLSGDFIYWIENGSRILRVRKDGTGLSEIANGLSKAVDLVIHEQREEVYWMEESGLWKTTLFCGSLPCSKSLQMNATNGGGLGLQIYSSGGFMVYWPEQSNGGMIRAFNCDIEFCLPSTLYPAPATPTLTWGIGTPATDGTDFFWVEVSYDSTTFVYNSRLRRMTAAVPQTIAENLNNIAAFPVYIDPNYVYFYDAKRITGPQGIRKLARNASVIARDIAIAEVEVTQGVQNLDNTMVLVAGKPTFVRVFGKYVSGLNAFNVEATLTGMRNGTPLPGSPLRSLKPLPQLWSGMVFNRASSANGWLFALPEEWRSGTVDLQVVIDPRNAQSDPVLANNSRNLSLAFLNKAPLCVILIPVRTDIPDTLGTTIFDPLMQPTLDLAERLMPMSEIWPFYSFNPVEEWPGGKYAPFEMGEDNLNVLTAVNTRAVFSSNPKVCKAANAGTNYTGIVATAANANNSAGGMGHFGLDSSWTALTVGNRANTSPYWPFSGQTYAHELGHNFGRLHVDCGNPDFNDSDYPYDKTLFADGTASGYYGFDSRTLTSISPFDGGGKVADLMSYCPPRWTSDYTWNALRSKLSDRPQVANSAAPAQILAGETVYVSGVISPTGAASVLGTAWVYANNAMGADLVSKWRGLDASWLHASTNHNHAIQGVHADAFHLRLLDGQGNVLTDQPITPTGNDHHGVSASGPLFAATFAAPTGSVARLELLNGGSLLAFATPGTITPTVAILTPAGGETVSDTLQVAWQANDADSGDSLLTTVQYSPDGGQSWYAILNDYPVTKNEPTPMDFDPSGLAGSAPNQALIRIGVSDGYHTAVATSQPFTLTNRAPFVTIAEPVAGSAADPQASVTLRGIAVDPEEGGLSGAALTWAVDGAIVGSGKEEWLQGLAPGEHAVTLNAQDSLAQSRSTSVTFTVAPLVVPLSSDAAVVAAVVIDGLCDDAIYASAAQVALANYANGEQATVRLVRTADRLWACFTGLVTDTATLNSVASLEIDMDHSGDPLAQSNDYRFFIDENGGVGTTAGDGAGNFAESGPGGVQAQVSFPLPLLWNAELSIDANVLGGWGHKVGLAASHSNAGEQEENRHWPAQTQLNQPKSWGATVLGTQAMISSLQPLNTTAGSSAFTLTVVGENFLPDATVLWNGQPLSTTTVSTTTLQAAVSAAQIVTASTVTVQVRNANNPASLPSPFVVEVPVPTIASLSPAAVEVGASPFTLTINGSNFLAGAQAVWNGEVLPATVVNGTQIQVSVDAARLQKVTPVSVAVVNPQPGGFSSNAKDFTITAKPDEKVFLPLVSR